LPSAPFSHPILSLFVTLIIVLLCDIEKNSQCKQPISSLFMPCRKGMRKCWFLFCRYHWGIICKWCESYCRSSSAGVFTSHNRSSISYTWTLNISIITLIVAHLIRVKLIKTRIWSKAKYLLIFYSKAIQ
jgi:hypothetical protein